MSFLNKKDLCARWNISYTTLEKWTDAGLIKPIRPGESYYSLAAIEASEMAGLDLEAIRPLKLKRLERENETLKGQLGAARAVIAQMQSLATGHLFSGDDNKCVNAQIGDTYER